MNVQHRDEEEINDGPRSINNLSTINSALEQFNTSSMDQNEAGVENYLEENVDVQEALNEDRQANVEDTE